MATVSRMVSATRPRRSTITRTAAAPNTSPVADSMRSAVKLPRTRKAVENGPAGVGTEPEPDEERGAEHHDSERHGAEGRTGTGRRTSVVAIGPSDVAPVDESSHSCCASPARSRHVPGSDPGSTREPSLKRETAQADSVSVTLGRWVRLARVASLAGLALYSLVIFAAPAQGRLEGFFDVWVYNALLVAATVIVGARAYLEPRERAAWTAFTAALACWTFGEIYTAAVQPEAYPSPADLGFIAFYPLVYVGMVALLRAHARSIGSMLWLDGLTASLAAGALAAAVLVELVLQDDGGLAVDRGDEPRLPARRRACCSRRSFGVFSLTRLEARPRAWLLLGLGVLSTVVRRRRLPLPELRRNLRGGTLGRHLLAGCNAADRTRCVGPGPQRRGSSPSKAAHCSSYQTTCALVGDRRARLRPLRPAEPARAGARDRHAARRASSGSCMTFRENRAALRVHEA